MLILERLARAFLTALEGEDEAVQLQTYTELSQSLAAITLDRMKHADTIAAARSDYAAPSDDNIEIDDDPLLSIADEGVWVGAWVWVATPDEDD